MEDNNENIQILNNISEWGKCYDQLIQFIHPTYVLKSYLRTANRMANKNNQYSTVLKFNYFMS